MTAPSRLTNCTFLANSLSFNGPCHHGNLIYILGLPSTIPLVFSFRRCSGPDELPSQWWLCQRCDNMCHWLPRGLQEQRLWMWRSVQQYGCSDFAISSMQCDTNNISHIMFIQTGDSLHYRMLKKTKCICKRGKYKPLGGSAGSLVGCRFCSYKISRLRCLVEGTILHHIIFFCFIRVI